MKEKIYCISDIEMGRGDVTDDFSDDELVANFLEYISSDEEETFVTLVLNGDTFDFMKMCYKEEHPRYITEEISQWKLEEVMRVHGRVFQAWREFLKNPRHAIHFVIGNHDADLAWPSLQRRIKKELETEDRVTFDFWYKKNDVHAEHGHLQDPFFYNDTRAPVIRYKGQEILNLPWGAFATFSHLVHFKKKYPIEERLFPKHEAIRRNKMFEKDGKKMTRQLALHSIRNSITRLSDPTYRVPYKRLATHILRHGFEFMDDEKFIRHRALDVMRQNPDKKVLVLGHAHLFQEIEGNGQKVLITDTWRDELDLRKNAAKKPKTFAQIEYFDGKLMSARLKEWEKT